MKKAIFIDKDGTLIPDIPFNMNAALITLEDGAVEGLKKLLQHEFMIVVITNQSGIAHGYFTEEDLATVEAHIAGLLFADNIPLHGFYYCPHSPDGREPEYTIDCECRKPKPGLLLQAAGELDIDLKQSWMIGDILNDVEAGNNAGCRSILIDNGNETDWRVDSDLRTPHFIASNISQAADHILETISNKDLLSIQHIKHEVKIGPSL